MTGSVLSRARCPPTRTAMRASRDSSTACYGNVLDGGEIRSTDLVYLLSEEELSWLVEADVNIRARPTAQAVRQDQTTWYNMYSLELGIEAYYWWLREPVPDTASNCYVVDIGYRSRLLRG